MKLKKAKGRSQNVGNGRSRARWSFGRADKVNEALEIKNQVTEMEVGVEDGHAGHKELKEGWHIWRGPKMGD